MTAANPYSGQLNNRIPSEMFELMYSRSAIITECSRLAYLLNLEIDVLLSVPFIRLKVVIVNTFVSSGFPERSV